MWGRLDTDADNNNILFSVCQTEGCFLFSLSHGKVCFYFVYSYRFFLTFQKQKQQQKQIQTKDQFPVRKSQESPSKKL